MTSFIHVVMIKYETVLNLLDFQNISVTRIQDQKVLQIAALMLLMRMRTGINFGNAFVYYQANLTSNISLLTQKTNEAEELLKKMDEDSQNMSIDDAVITTAPLYNQYVACYTYLSLLQFCFFFKMIPVVQINFYRKK